MTDDYVPRIRGLSVVTNDARVIYEELLRVTEEVVRFMGVRMIDRLTEPAQSGGTPFDTGHLSSNWIWAAGTPNTAVYGSNKSQSTVDYGYQELGIAKAMKYKFTQGDVFVTNNVPYCNLLNATGGRYGNVGFIERAITMTLNDTVMVFEGEL